MSQFFINKSLIQANRVVLMGEEAHHARDVFRIRKGDRIRLFDGEGKGYEGCILRFSKEDVEIEIQSEFDAAPKKGPRLILAQSVLPRDAMDWSIRKATELGVDEIIPLAAERSVARMNSRRREDKKNHWDKIALSACKQCERLTIPEISEIKTQGELAGLLSGVKYALLADTRPGAKTLKGALQAKDMKPSEACLLIVGPEGGFTDQEMHALQGGGVETVSLGEEILRSETAGLFFLSVFRYLFR